MNIVSTFTHNNTTFGLDSEGNYWILTPVPTLTPSTKDPQEEFSLEAEVSGILKKLEIPQHILGFDYLITAICLIARDATYRKSITGILYPKIAEVHDTTSPRIERSIRHAIEQCEFNELYYDLFGSKESPTNKQFVITVANKFKKMD